MSPPGMPVRSRRILAGPVRRLVRAFMGMTVRRRRGRTVHRGPDGARCQQHGRQHGGQIKSEGWNGFHKHMVNDIRTAKAGGFTATPR